MATCILFSALISICFFWVDVIDLARANQSDDVGGGAGGGGSDDLSAALQPRCFSMRNVLNTIVWVLALSLGVVQEVLGPLWLFRSIKCFALACVLVVVAGTFFRYGFIIYRSLQQQVVAVASQPSSPHADFDTEQFTAGRSNAAFASPPPPSSSSRSGASTNPSTPKQAAGGQGASSPIVFVADDEHGAVGNGSGSDAAREQANPLVSKILRVMCMSGCVILGLPVACHVSVAHLAFSFHS